MNRREMPPHYTCVYCRGNNYNSGSYFEGEKNSMHKLNRLTLNATLLAFVTLISAVSTWAQGSQSALGPGFGVQSGAVESPDRQSRPIGADATRRLKFWNEITLKANARDHARVAPQSPDQVGPTRTARAFAIVHIAVFDAYNVIVGGFESYAGLDLASLDSEVGSESARRSASVDAAIAQAAGDTLIALYPSQAADIAAIQRVDLGTIPNGPAKDAGIRIGRRTADVILAIRSTDGSQHAEPLYGVPPPNGYLPNPTFGKWRQDPISLNPVALGAFWPRVRPFVILSADQFRSINPPALTSAAYATAYNEVKRLGGENSTERTKDQTIAGIYWGYDGAPFLGTPPRLYNQIAVQIAGQKGTTGIRLARLLALVNVAMADAGLASWDTKYDDEFWRPITGIRQGQNDNNPATIGDPNFVPLGAPASNTSGPNFTPPFPAYTSGHATFGSALFQILRRFYRTDAIAFSFISDEFNGVTRDNRGNIRPLILRPFNSLAHAEEENGQSRIYLGIHWAFDKTEGIKQGRQVANFTFNNSFRRQTLDGVLTAEE